MVGIPGDGPGLKLLCFSGLLIPPLNYHSTWRMAIGRILALKTYEGDIWLGVTEMYMGAPFANPVTVLNKMG